MIQSLKVTNYKGESLSFTLRDPASSGFFILGIDGLGPPEANINITELLNLDGGLYNSSRVTTRNIVLNFGMWLYATETIEELRLKLYRYFPIMKKVILELTTDSRTATIAGYVESNEPNIFSKVQIGNISILCPYPYFEDPDVLDAQFSGSYPLFEFPFSNESTTEGLIEFSELLLTGTDNLIYPGDIETGIEITAVINGDVTDLRIFNTTLYQIMTFDSTIIEDLTGNSPQDGDVIFVNTRRGEKSVTLIRSGVAYNILGSVTADSTWLTVQPGDNQFGFDATVGEQYVQLYVRVHVVYEGM